MISHFADRRRLLRATGLSLTLPMLESVGEETAVATPDADPPAPAKRLVCVGSNLGLYRPAFYPEASSPAESSTPDIRQGVNSDYTPSPLLKEIDHHRGDFTVFSGLDHRAGNGHKNWDNYLCGPQVGSVSLDQIAAEKVGQTTRFDSLQLCAGDLAQQKMVYSRQGVPLPMINRPSVVFNRLFTSGMDRQRQQEMLTSGRSALDLAHQDA
ncbi:MAG: DUF1552 domain-containing protein, partial [Planctomycetota bacterium]